MSSPTIAAESEDVVPGTVIAERYRVERVLGRGGMGVVYEGEHLKVGRRIAVKVLASDWARNPHISSRFRAEARAASAAGHPNIIEVLDAGELPDGRPYLVTELIKGRDLFEEIQAKGPLDLVRVCRIGTAIARALEAAHERGIIHRDLKPENVMLARHGEQEVIKVLDFGIAADTSSPERRATVMGQVLGTPATMAPEQAAGQPATIAFDVYAIGVILFQMISGREPFEASTTQGLLMAKIDQDAPSVATLRRGVPTELVALVDRCLARDPHARPESAAAVAQQLERVQRELMRHPTPVPVETVPDGLEAPPQRSSSRWLMGAVAALVVVGATGLTWWVLAGPRGAEVHAASGRDEPPPTKATPPATDTRAEAGTTGPSSGSTGPSDGEGSDEGSDGGSDGSSGAPPEATTADAEPEDAATTSTPAVTVQRRRPPPPVVAPPEPRADEGPAPTDCLRTRKQARQARDVQDWAGILRHTSHRSCWQDEGSERLYLRTMAFKELGRWDDCIASGRRLSGAEPEAWVRTCEKRKERGE